jgi:hypothetical protein
MIGDLIKKLTEDERQTLQQRIAASNAMIYQFIDAFLRDPDISKEAIEKKFKINGNTYFKNLTLAKDEIYEVIKVHIKNAYDDLLLTNVLYRRGLETYASKLRLKLEDEYEKQGWWNVLNEVYNVDMMVHYSKCDIDAIRKTKDKILLNIDRLAAYTRVDKEIILCMAIIEKGALKEDEYENYEAGLERLLAEALKVDHHIPIFNAMHCYFMLYTKYMINKEKAEKTVAEISSFLDRYRDHLIPFTKNVATLNLMGFYAIFELDTDPEVYFRDIESAIGSHGLLYDSQAMMNYCSYYFLRKDFKQFDRYYQQFLKLDMDRSFAYKIAYVKALRAYLMNDSRDFYLHQNEFYQMDDSREYDEYNLTLRYLEKMFLLKEGNFSLAQDKMDATVKFIRRNMSKARVELEKANLDIIRSRIKKTAIKPIKEPVYRLTTLLHQETSAMHGM